MTSPQDRIDWAGLVEANRRLDAAVAEQERSLLAGRPDPVQTSNIHRMFQPTRAPAPPVPAPEPAPVPAAAPVAVSRGPAPTVAVAAVPLAVIGSQLPKGVERLAPRTRRAPVETVPTEAVDAQIRQAIALLERELADARARRAPTYLPPWGGEPRPRHIPAEDGDGETLQPNPIPDDEIRDRLQPHWRAVHQRFDSAKAELETAEAHAGRGGLLGRIGRSRRTLLAARVAFEEAERARTAVDLIWNGDAMRGQFTHLRSLADAAFAQGDGADSAEGDLVRRLEALKGELTLVETLRARGVDRVTARPTDTRQAALQRAVDESEGAAGG